MAAIAVAIGVTLFFEQLRYFRIVPITGLEATILAYKVLLVDDDEIVRMAVTVVLEQRGFAVTCATNVVEALKCISADSYDALVSDLHMPGAGDGLTVVSAMRHANPTAVTLLLSAFPEMEAAAQAILLQADEIMVKPMDLMALTNVIQQRIAIGPARTRVVESVGAILARTTESIIAEWYRLVLSDSLLMSVPMTREHRCHHLPQVLRDIVVRLGSSRLIGSKETMSAAAAEHGLDRESAGYTAPMLVEESRILQVSIFHNLQNNLANIDFSLLLIGVMNIADEVDSQLSQAMESYTANSFPKRRAAGA
jgi:CheY-like chemotaxis protein